MRIIIKILAGLGFILMLAIPTIIISLTIRGPREANFNRYNIQTIAYVDTISWRQGRWSLIFSYTVENNIHIGNQQIRSRTPLPKGTPVRIRYSQTNPHRAVVHLDYPIQVNDSIELYFTRYRLGGIHYILRRRE
jgi:hypothetical protein